MAIASKFILKKREKEEEIKAKDPQTKILAILDERLTVPRSTVKISELKTLVPNVQYKDSIKEPFFENLVMIGKSG